MTDTTVAHRPRIERILTDRLLGYLTLTMLAAVIVALARGRAEWPRVPWPVWLHLATLMPALAITPLILNQRKGDRRHRTLGYVWITLLVVTAIDSFAIRLSNPGRLSFIHIISAWVLVQTVLIVVAARNHNIVRHRRSVRGMVIGALLIAGFFTFPFNRLLGHWLLG